MPREGSDSSPRHRSRLQRADVDKLLISGPPVHRSFPLVHRKGAEQDRGAPPMYQSSPQDTHTTAGTVHTLILNCGQRGAGHSVADFHTNRQELVPGAKKVALADNSLNPHSRTASTCLLIGVKNAVVIAAR